MNRTDGQLRSRTVLRVGAPMMPKFATPWNAHVERWTHHSLRSSARNDCCVKRRSLSNCPSHHRPEALATRTSRAEVPLSVFIGNAVTGMDQLLTAPGA